jgi:hypothetical protein
MPDYCRFRIFLITTCMLFSAFVSSESVREYHQRKCLEGNTESCKRAEAMIEGERHANRIDELGDQFASKVDRSELELDNKPLLSDAYFVVINDYFTAEAESGLRQTLSNDMLDICAEHFHNHWLNRKLWWPTSEDGKPDWSTTYYYIVEHYYGYCLRSVQ